MHGDLGTVELAPDHCGGLDQMLGLVGCGSKRCRERPRPDTNAHCHERPERRQVTILTRGRSVTTAPEDSLQGGRNPTADDCMRVASAVRLRCACGAENPTESLRDGC